VRSPSARPAILLAVALAAAPVFGSPPPAPRAPWTTPAPAPAPVRDDATALRAVPGETPQGPCGTRLEAAIELLERRAAADLAAPLPTPHSVDTAGIAVLEDDGTFFYAIGGNTILDLAAVTQAYYRTHDDDVPVLAIYLASGLSQWLGSPTALASAWPVRNEIDGIGLSRFDVGASFGSPSKLEVALTMNGLDRYLDDPEAIKPGDTFNAMGILAHEFGHRWLSYTYVDSQGIVTPALLGRDREHWGFFFDCDSSFMEGCDWTAIGADSFVTTGATSTFGALDQYLMGLRSKAEMDSFFVVNDPQDMNPPGVYVPWSIPGIGIGCHGRATRWAVDDIEAVYGPRVPDAPGAPHQWRVAIALVVPRGQDATAFDLAKLSAVRTRFPGLITAATAGRGAVDVTLSSRPGHLVIAHEPLPDTEDGTTPRTVGARVTREGGALPLHVDPSAVLLHWRPGTVGAFAGIPMAPAGPDSFAATLPALPGGGTVQYWLSAASEPAVLAAQLPAAGAAAPFSCVVGPDLVPPVVLHVPVPAQAELRLPQTLLARADDNLGLDSVWCEVAVDGGATTAVPVTPVGHDSFTVAIGAGVHAGHRVAYRFVARDASAAHHLGWSNPAFDTLRVLRDWLDDFENPSGYLHWAATWSYRDVWDLDTGRSSPPGGTSWHFGAADGAPCPPHSDSYLLLPWVYGLGPGVTLSFDEWHDLEQQSDSKAWDAFRLEVVPWGGGAATPVTTTPGFSHTMLGHGLSIPAGAPCWSGDSHGWVTRTLDLSGWAPGPVRVQVHALADDFVGRGGVWIDRVRVHYPNSAPLDAPGPPATVECGRAWPNPTRGALRLPLALPRASEVDWAIHDVQGRRVATLWRGRVEAGRTELIAVTPRGVPAGLYFASLRVDGRATASQRIAIVR
jgi:hypothetical protein